MRKKGFRIQKGKNKRQQFERERIILTANKEGKGGNAGGTSSELLYGILPVLGALQHRRRKLDHLYLKLPQI